MTAERMPCRCRPVDLLVGVARLTGHRVTQDRACEHDLAGTTRVRVEQVALGPMVAADAGDHLLADRVQRRVGHLREQLLK